MPDLCRDFVEALLTKATVMAHQVDVSEVDRTDIRRACEGATSVEQASGSTVTAAFVAARRIAGGTEELFGSVASSRFAAPTSDGWAGETVLEHSSAQDEAAAWTEDSSFDGSIDTAAVLPLVEPPNLANVGHSTDLNLEELHGEVPKKRSILRSSGWFTCFTWTFNLGGCVLLFVAWQLWGTSIAQHHEQHRLQSTFEATLRAHHSSISTSKAPSLIPGGQSVPAPAEGAPVAQLQIPAIGLDEIVVSGTAEGDLAKGPGHYVGTAAPGQAGNVSIAGHRTTNGAPFNRLGQLAVGNQIYLTTTTGERLEYVVSQAPKAVSPSDVTVLDSFGDNRITLTTCNPEFSSSQRLIVVGELNQPNPPTAVHKTKPRPYHVVNAQTASWGLSSLPKVVIEAGFLILLGLSNRRFSAWYGGIGRWLILTPVWIVGLFVLFQGLSTFLPAAV